MKTGEKKKYTTTRECYKTVKKYDHQKFDEFCTRIYMNGYNDALKNIQKNTEPSVSIEEVLELIGDVKGVGPALAGRIKVAVDNMILEKGGTANGTADSN